MKIAVVADKKSGHLTQCLGLRDVIQDYDHEKDVLFLGKDFISLPGFLEKLFTFFKENFYLFILRLLNPSIGDKKYDLVVLVVISKVLVTFWSTFSCFSCFF